MDTYAWLWFWTDRAARDRDYDLLSALDSLWDQTRWVLP